ncbi:MAG: YceI family protein [Candidatus Eremiobacteraeota bacterium]|nr:YceI family protein [Candidatus Eremiobacteraeota bacterium]MBV8354040.1 YceI family protein [Candidatus Eremiobacteraeota bacterium]
MSTFLRVPAVVLTTLLLQPALPARAQTQAAIDLNHTGAHFAARHLVISTVQGSIPVKSVDVKLGTGYVPTSVEAVLDLTKIDTHNEKRDNDLRSDRFLAVAKYPEMTFKSTKVTPGSGGAFTVDGMLTIRGVTQPISLNGNVEGSVKDKEGRTHVGYSAVASLDRGTWGVGTSIPTAVVGSTIQITIEAEVILS